MPANDPSWHGPPRGTLSPRVNLLRSEPDVPRPEDPLALNGCIAPGCASPR